MTVRSKYRWALLFTALQLTWVCEAPIAAAEPSQQSRIQDEDDDQEEEPGDPYPGDQFPEDPYPEDPYPGEPYPGEPYPGDPYPGEPSESGEPGYPDEPGTNTPGNDETGNPGTDMPTTGTTRTTSGGIKRPTGVLVPLYIYPSDGAWQPLIDQKIKHRSVDVIAVVNPNHGPGGARDSKYTKGIGLLVDAGIQVIGYVSTDRGNVREAKVQSDIRAWKELYPQVGGIFFDEQSSELGQETYYTNIVNYAKKDMGFSLAVGNPGTLSTKPPYFDILDIVLVHELNTYPTIKELTDFLTNRNISREKCAVTPYGMSQLDPVQVETLSPYVKYIYVSDGIYKVDLWTGLPQYLPELFSTLDPP